MALVEGPAGAFPLHSGFTIGRAPGCDLVVSDPRVSAQHATIRFVDGAWEVRDLGSTNGTTLNGRRIPRGGVKRLRAGSRIQVGGDVELVLVDDRPPDACARRESDGAFVAARGGLLALPDEEHPAATLFVGTRGEWTFDHDGELLDVEDGEVVVVDGVAWRLFLPGVLDHTFRSDDDHAVLTTITLQLRERAHGGVSAWLRMPRRVIDLETRRHHELLLLLARARGETPEPLDALQGWVVVDEALRVLDVDTRALHVLVHRARRQLTDAGVDGAAGLVERRDSRLRLGPVKVLIEAVDVP